MSYTDDEIIRQLRLGEDSYWEFKQIEFSGNRPRSPSRDDWADEISAFANTAGGVLVCGVTDAGEVQGMSREQIVELDSVLVGISSDAIKPAVRLSAPITENWMVSGCSSSMYLIANRSMIVQAEALFG